MTKRPFATTVHALIDSVEKTPEAVAIDLIEKSGETVALTYAALYQMGCHSARGLWEHGINAGDRLLVVLPSSRDFFVAYMGVLLGGVIPIIIPVPRPNRPLDAFVDHLKNAAHATGANHAVLADEMKDHLFSLNGLALIAASSLDRHVENSPSHAPPDESRIAHLQATSGSTGAPKFAIIRHKNIAVNAHAIGEATKRSTHDVVVSWLPYFHDMGLIAIHCALYWQCRLVTTDPANFVRNPINYWLRLIHRFGGTISPAPNSAYQICVRLAKRRKLEDLDLSPWRVAFCGAEPIHADTIRQFQEVFGQYGFRKTTLLPVYGLAESTLASTVPDVNTVPKIESIDAELMETRGQCLPATSETKRRVEIVSVGKALPEHSIRIVDSKGPLLEDRQIGEIEFFGPSVIDGYWNQSQESHSLKRADGFLRTGDLGYVADGHLFVTGRKKDIIIIGGRNLSPSQIEAIVEKAMESDLTSPVAAVGIQDQNFKTENLHLIIESRTPSGPNQPIIEEKIRNLLDDTFGVGGVIIHWVERGRIPKTTSGKIMRFRCREMIRSQFL